TTILSSEPIVDEIPVLAVAAAFAEGTTEIRDAAELRVKESDRIASLAALLRTAGIDVETTGDGLAVRGSRPHAGHFAAAGHHRTALAASVLAVGAAGATSIEGWEAVAVSYPGFDRDLGRLTGGRP